MTQRLDLATWFTRRQSDARYLQTPLPPLAPTGLTYVSTGLFTDATDPAQAAYINVTLVPPVTPSWANPPSSGFITSFAFHCTFHLSGGDQTIVVKLPYNGVGPYQVAPLVAGASTTITVATVDYLLHEGPVDGPLTHTTASDTVPPASPTITATVDPSGASILIAVSNSESDFDHYELQRSQNSAAFVAVTSFTNADVPLGIFIDQAIPADDTYRYKLLAYDVSGNFSTSNITTPISLIGTGHAAPLQPDLVGPPATTLTSVVSGALILVFNPNLLSTSPNLKGYRIYRRRHSETFWMLLDSLLASPAPTVGTRFSYVDAHTTPGIQYDYTVSAFDIYGIESTKDTVNFVTATAIDTLVPLPPGPNLQMVGDVGGIRVTWDVSPSSVLLYGLSYRYASLGVSALTTFSDEILVQGNSFTLHGLIYPTTALPPGREILANQFEVRIRARASNGLFSSYLQRVITFPELLNYYPADNTIPVAPILSTPVINNDGSIDLLWTAPSIPDVAGYQIEQLDNEILPWRVIARVSDNLPGAKHLLVTGLEPYKVTNKQYRFRIRTEDFSGNLSNPNLVINPGFESGLTSWTSLDSSATADLTHTHNTSAGAASASNLGQLSQIVPVNTGLNYTFSAFARKNTSNVARLTIEWQDNTHLTLTSKTITLALTNNYQRLILSAVAASIGDIDGSSGNAAYAKLILSGDIANPGNLVYWDDVQFEASPWVSDYADGKTGLLQAADLVGPGAYSGSPALGLSATGSLGAINLRWTNPSFANKDYFNSIFEIWRDQTVGGGGTFTKLSSVPGNNDGKSNGYDDLDPSEGTGVTWHYKLAARDRFGNLGPFLNADPGVFATSLTPNDLSISTKDGIAPTVPNVTAVTANSDGTVTITWDESTTGTPINGVNDRHDLAGYIIWRKKQADATYLRIHTVKAVHGSGSLSYIDQSVDLGSLYNYEVSSFDTQSDESIKSSTGSLVSVVDNRVPAVPATLTGRGTIGGLLLSWTPSATVGVTKYRVTVPQADGYPVAGAQVFDVVGTTSIAQLLGGTSSTDASVLAITVEAYSRSGGALSAARTMTAISATEMYGYVPIDKVLPAAPATKPTLVAGGNLGGGITVTWPASTSNDARLYALEMAQADADGSITPGPFYQVATVYAPTVSARVGGVELTGHTGKNYFFRVRTIDTAGNVSASFSPTSDPIPSLEDATAPGVPQPILTTSLDTTSTAQISISWPAITDRDLSYYILDYYRSDGAGGITSQTLAKDLTSFTARGLPPATGYSVRMRAVDYSGNVSGFTNPVVTVTTAAIPGGTNHTPGAPSISISETVFSRSYRYTITISAGTGGGTAPNADGDLSYHAIFRSENGGDFVQVGTVAVAAAAVAGSTTTYIENISRAPDGTTDIQVSYKANTIDTGGLVSPFSATLGPYNVSPWLDPCPTLDTYVSWKKQVRDLKVGDKLLVFEDRKLRYYPILDIVFSTAECYRIDTENGASKEVSYNTPVELRNGSFLWAKDLCGQQIATIKPSWWRRLLGIEKVQWSAAEVTPVGIKEVAFINLGGKVFAGGIRPSRMIFTHNLKY